MVFAETCRVFMSVALGLTKTIVPVVLICLVLIFSLFVGAAISSIFLHPVEF
jgi:hypothetical protein